VIDRREGCPGEGSRHVFVQLSSALEEITLMVSLLGITMV